MALRTAGSTTTTVLQAIRFGADVTPQDMGTLANLIRDDKVNAAGSHLRLNQAMSNNCILFVPNRGILHVLPGD